jgi:hypothetical protein
MEERPMAGGIFGEMNFEEEGMCAIMLNAKKDGTNSKLFVPGGQ